MIMDSAYRSTHGLPRHKTSAAKLKAGCGDSGRTGRGGLFSRNDNWGSNRGVSHARQVGETGTGKTALIQYLARLVGAELTVLNLSNQSDSTDFIGGYKPVDEGRLCAALVPTFRSLFSRTFPQVSSLGDAKSSLGDVQGVGGLLCSLS